MTQLIKIALVASVLSLSIPAFANAASYGNALRDAADAGQLTPGGVGDSKAFAGKN